MYMLCSRYDKRLLAHCHCYHYAMISYLDILFTDMDGRYQIPGLCLFVLPHWTQACGTHRSLSSRGRVHEAKVSRRHQANVFSPHL